jgi:tetratricopeptide (TPR) repeat protein
VRELWFKLTSGKTVNGRALLILMAAVVVGGAGLFFLHRFQVGRNAEGAYEQAKIAEAKGDKALAVYYLQQFLSLDPSHTEALAKLGLLRSEQAANRPAMSRALETLDQVLLREPQRDDIRREAVGLAVKLGRYSDGLHHLNVLLPDAAKSDDVELLKLRARCERGLRHYDEAAKFYKQALAKGPQQPDIVLEYAALLRGDLKLQAAADVAVEQMVARAKRSPEARLGAARYFSSFGMPKRAWEHLRFALDELGPPSAELLHLAGDVALNLGEPEEARKLFE